MNSTHPMIIFILIYSYEKIEIYYPAYWYHQDCQSHSHHQVQWHQIPANKKKKIPPIPLSLNSKSKFTYTERRWSTCLLRWWAAPRPAQPEPTTTIFFLFFPLLLVLFRSPFALLWRVDARQQNPFLYLLFDKQSVGAALKEANILPPK